MTPLTILLLLLLAISAGAWWREHSRRRTDIERYHREQEETKARYETELREQALHTAALFDRMVEGVIVTDAAGRIRLANAAVAALFGGSGPMTGRTLLEATVNHQVAAVAQRLASEPEVIGQELVLEQAATPRYLQINALALRAAGGAATGAIFVFHDLTRLRRLEAVRQEFVANVSHELRTPLSLIKSAAETLLDGGKNDPAALTRFLEIIDKHANRLTLLIDDLLLLSTLDSGQVRLNLQPVLVREIVREVCEELGARAKAQAVTLENAVPPELVARADSERLHQVLTNLLDNAIKYGRRDGLVRVTGTSVSGGRIEVAVADDGPGLPVEARARVFERFYRVDKGRSREQGGTGLGLAIVKHVVQAHGGEVRVESEPGKGATFFFTLPKA
jgi:two-component system phosphate regulon sensor histidine kinase PhoR